MEPEPHIELPPGWQQRDGWSWRQRYELVSRLYDALVASENPQAYEEGLAELASDPKWEVRQAVAQRLDELTEDVMIALLARLRRDSNRDVQHSAERVQKRIAQGRKVPTAAQPLPTLPEVIDLLERRVNAKTARTVKEVVQREIAHTVTEVAHDVINTLQPVITAADRLLYPQESSGPLFQAEEVKMIRQQTMRALEVLKAMKEYSKPVRLDLREEAINPLVSETVRNVQSHFEGSSRPVTFQLRESGSYLVKVDRTALDRALHNLLKNAAEAYFHPRAKERKPVILVDLQPAAEPSLLQISIRDQGAGIDPGTLGKLREFYPGTHSNKADGTGFGLPNAARLIRELGGMLKLDSVYGEGTTATVFLPLSTEI